jgi:hypothetical protein
MWWGWGALIGALATMAIIVWCGEWRFTENDKFVLVACGAAVGVLVAVVSDLPLVATMSSSTCQTPADLVFPAIDLDAIKQRLLAERREAALAADRKGRAEALNTYDAITTQLKSKGKASVRLPDEPSVHLLEMERTLRNKTDLIVTKRVEDVYESFGSNTDTAWLDVTLVLDS